MIVLEHGDTYETIRCKDCNAFIGYCGKDIIEKTYLNREHMSCVRYIKCPECGEKIIICISCD